jgi:cell division protein FtsN
MNERIRDILVISGISVLLMIGTYKCGRESVVSEPLEEPEVFKESKPQLFVDEDTFFEEEKENKSYLIVGSYYNIEMAQNHVDNLSNQGFESFIVEGDGYYRVSIFSSIYIDKVYNAKDKYLGQIDKMWVYSE